MSEDEAVEYFYYNVEGVYVGEKNTNMVWRLFHLSYGKI
jgi:hypothetical protein